MWARITLAVVFAAYVTGGLAAQRCVPRSYGYSSVVCVCNATYCDTVASTTSAQLATGGVRHYSSTKAGKRLELAITKFYPTPRGKVARRKLISRAAFRVNQGQRYQEIFGFGGAATDAATINTYSLSARVAEKLIRSYFGKEGIGYTLVRVPVGSSDFSAHYYGYTDHYPEDITLRHFNLSMEDFQYKAALQAASWTTARLALLPGGDFGGHVVRLLAFHLGEPGSIPGRASSRSSRVGIMPFIKRAKQMSPFPVKLIATPWSAPDWMKVINHTTNVNWLRKGLFKVYADLYVRFLDGYEAEGLDFWGLTPQNEPSEGIATGKFNKMGWTTEDMITFLVRDFCPLLKERGHGGVKVMINDDQRRDVAEWLKTYNNEDVYECAAGMAVHWYKDQETPAAVLSEAHRLYPHKFLLYTEACFGKDAALCPRSSALKNLCP
ncbi:hypothetical protein PR048_004057 [Dryococelus australis]|uniref:Glucosylceramidase n=1 Tax=Dryococelus australis TaxID=614101 RepID=A0ABQ9I4E9_9NEOP|nr:hypothetical protein PR048_004057 [Dryococelus australis]